MPSRFSSGHSRDDAAELAANLGIEYLSIPIEPAHAAMLEMLAGAFDGSEPVLPRRTSSLGSVATSS